MNDDYILLSKSLDDWKSRKDAEEEVRIHGAHNPTEIYMNKMSDKGYSTRIVSVKDSPCIPGSSGNSIREKQGESLRAGLTMAEASKAKDRALRSGEDSEEAYEDVLNQRGYRRIWVHRNESF